MPSNTLNNRYRLDKKIGEGGFAHVFLATDLLLGRQVAVKLLEESWIKDKELLTRFHNEARAIAVLDHPNILQIYDFGVVKEAPYLVMPYISGGTLADRMKQGPFTLDEIRVYLDQIGSALDYAHQHGIVHRDVKPSNLLMRPNGQLVLMDFGLAKLLENAALAEKTGVLGTVAYMAPEQYQGLVSSASDIYMLGVLLYQMLAGKLPFEGNTTAMIVAHVHLTPGSLMGQPTMRSVSPAVIRALDQVIMKVLAKLPADRYPTCQALSAAYYNALKADPQRHGKQPIQRDFSETVISDQPLVMQPAPTGPGGKSRPVTPSLPVPVPPTPVLGLPDATIIEPLDKAPAPVSPPPAPGALDETIIDPPGEVPGPVSPTPGLSSPDATVIAPSPAQRKKILLKPPRLLVTTEPDKGFRATFNLTGETLTLGRAKDNDLCLPLLIISRHHAVLQRLNSDSQELSYKIVQGKSVNPLFFKGKRVAEKVLEHGDTIEIGERGFAEYVVKLTFQAAEYGFAGSR